VNVTILFVGLVVFAFFAAHLLNRYAVRYVPLSGVEYLLVGALIGPQLPPRLLSSDSLEQLRPLVSLLLGVMGFLVGLQAHGKPNRYTLTGAVIALATVLALAVPFAAAFGALVSPNDPALIERTLFVVEGYRFELFFTREQCAVALVLAATAGVAFSSARPRGLRAEVPAFQLLRQAALASQWVAIASVALVLAWSRSRSQTSSVENSAAYWFLGAILLGVVLGGCFTLFVGQERATSRLFLATVGTVTFGAGIGAELGVSPLFVNLVAGATVAFSSSHHAELRAQLNRLHHPTAVLLLVLAGALWIPPAEPTLWLFPVVYLACRWIARKTLPSFFTWLLTPIEPTRVGVGLLRQGTLAVAVALDFALRAPEHAGLVLTTGITGALAFDVLARGALRRYLVDAETEHSATTALSSEHSGAEA
jgi:Kef-type K+ transport system membrane component KefB